MRYSIACLIAVLSLTTASSFGDEPEKQTATMTSTGEFEIGGKTLDQWIKSTKHLDPAIRESAVRAIGQFPEAEKKKAILALIPRLRDLDSLIKIPDSGVCGSTIVTFQSIRLDPAEIGQ